MYCWWQMWHCQIQYKAAVGGVGRWFARFETPLLVRWGERIRLGLGGVAGGVRGRRGVNGVGGSARLDERKGRVG